MAAVAVSAYKVNASTDKALHQKAHTSLWSLLRGAPRTSGIGLKAAYVTLVWGAAETYETGGLPCNLLANLPGWTEILTVIGQPTYNSTSTACWELPQAIDQNSATAGNRKLVLSTVTPAGEAVASEVANGRTMASAGCELLVIGY